MLTDAKAEVALQQLLGRRPIALLEGCKAQSRQLAYARKWVPLVAYELQQELAEGLSRPPPRGTREWLLSVQSKVKDSQAVNLNVQAVSDSEGTLSEGEEAEDEARLPPLLYMLLLSMEHNLVFFISGWRPRDSGGDVFRAVALDGRPIRNCEGGHIVQPPNLFRHKCVEIGSAQAALQRVHTLCSINLLNQSLSALLMDDVMPEAGPWRPLDPADAQQQRQLARLNDGQRRALRAMGAPCFCVQGPPGTGKSSFITAVSLSRVPHDLRILACTATNKAIDSLVSKLEAAGVTEMLAVGSQRNMGERAIDYLMSRRLAREPGMAKADAALRAASERRMAAEAELQVIPKHKKKGGGHADDVEAPLLVARQQERLEAMGPAERARPTKNTSGTVRMVKILHQQGYLGAELEPPRSVTPAELLEASRRFLTGTPEGTEAMRILERQEVKARFAKLQKEETELRAVASVARTEARRRVWRSVKVVACTASAALQVTRRLKRDLEAEGEEGVAEGKEGGNKELEAMKFDIVVLDEAGAMLEVDAVGCMLHGARGLLLVGDQAQLPPFTKWKDGQATGYTVSLMARLAAAFPKHNLMLTEQYRMHSAICRVVSTAFYKGKLTTSESTAKARMHPIPASFVDVARAREERNGMSFFNHAEATAVVRLSQHYIHRAAFSPQQITVLTFYNAQRDLLTEMLAEVGFSEIPVTSVDAMQGRESDVVILSCVRCAVPEEPRNKTGLGFLSDSRRLNVALSRARETMVVLGCGAVLRTDRLWVGLLKSMRWFQSYDDFEYASCREVAVGWATSLQRRNEAAAAEERRQGLARREASLALRSLAEANTQRGAFVPSAVSRAQSKGQPVPQTPDDWESDAFAAANANPPDDWEAELDGRPAGPPPDDWETGPEPAQQRASEEGPPPEDWDEDSDAPETRMSEAGPAPGACEAESPPAEPWEAEGSASAPPEPATTVDMPSTDAIGSPQEPAAALEAAPAAPEPTAAEAMPLVGNGDATNGRLETQPVEADQPKVENGDSVVREPEEGAAEAPVKSAESVKSARRPTKAPPAETAAPLGKGRAAASAAASKRGPGTPQLQEDAADGVEGLGLEGTDPSIGIAALKADVERKMAAAKMLDAALARKLQRVADSYGQIGHKGDVALLSAVWSWLLAPLVEASTKKLRAKVCKDRLQRAAPLFLGMRKAGGVRWTSALLEALEASCEQQPALEEMWERLVVLLYESDGDLLPEDVIFAWADEAEKEPQGSTRHRLFAQSSNLLAWLREADADDSS